MTAPTESTDSATHQASDPKRFRALWIIAIAQLMIVLDSVVVTIALPSAQHALHISTANRQWALTAYTLAFGGLLLLGGRIADLLGRKRIFVFSLIGFAAASALGGLASDAAMLFAARALQGAFAALMAPAALSLLTVTFTDPKERARAFGVFAGISGGGAAIGLVLGGLLTEYASWRWTLLINVPIAAFAAILATRVITESRSEDRARIDVPGSVLSTVGLLALVYGCTKAATDGWASGTTLTYLLASVVLLAAFVVVELRTTSPLLPMRIITNRNRAGAFLGSTFTGIALLGTFLSLTYYLQGTLHYSALKSGFAFLPISGGVIVSAGVASNLLPRVGPKRLAVVGTALGTIGMFWFTRIGVQADFLGRILPAEVVLSLGMGLAFVSFQSTSLFGVGKGDAGVASALVNTTQQIGGALGTALLNTITVSASATYIAAHGHAHIAQGLVHGYTTAFVVSAAILGAAFVAAALLIERQARSPIEPADAVLEFAELGV